MQTFTENEDTLCLFFAIFRHGQRAPVRFSPTDPNKKLWPNGLGSLTNVGKKQAYEAGKFLRHRYGHFLNETYSKEEIYVRSTDVDRCLMTAQCCLAGLYPPKKNDIWNEELMWQPIPIHSGTPASDPLNIKFIHKFEVPPQGYPKERQKKAYKVLQDNKDTMKALAKEYENKDDVSLILQLLDTYLVEADAKIRPHLPPDFDLDINKATLIYESIYDLLCQTSRYIVAASVYLLQDIVAKATKKIHGDTPNQKAFIYSLHDISITGCLAAFTEQFFRPNYTATLLFEMHKHPQAEEYYIKILYKNSPEDELVEIPINGSKLISLNEFQEITKNFENDTKIWTEQSCSNGV